jgi:hypothetical protein
MVYPWYIHGRSDSLLFFLVWLNFGVYHGISLLVCFFGILSLSKTQYEPFLCAKLVTFGGDLRGVLNGMP